MGRHL